MKKAIFTAFLVFAAAGALLASPPVTETFTPTDTITPTFTITETATYTTTPTFTPTFTITPTWTPWPVMANATPQDKVFAYPNPAKSGDRMAVAYPLDNAKTPKEVRIVIYSSDGSLAGKAVDEGPYLNGYTAVDTAKFARGVYIFKVTISYTDGTEQTLPARKFAIVK